ncbi:MAG TPA: beta-L-arabinofuranosidase domain-containing protein, partial [Fimbriimonas sp.]
SPPPAPSPSLRDEEGVLGAIRRLADYLVDTAPAYSERKEQAKDEFMYYTQGLEGLVGAYRLIRDPRHLELARSMAGMVWEEPKHHSHSYISSLLGILALYEATREEGYLQFALDQREKLTKMVTVDGGVTEQLPDKWCTEFCSVADWFMLNLRLGLATQRIDLLDEAEKILYNALYFNQFASGGFGTWHVNKEHGYPGRVEMGSGEAYWCCCFHGARSLYEAIASAVTTNGTTVSVNLPVPGEFGPVKVETDYPVSGQVTLTALEDVASLRLRVPAWATNAFLDDSTVACGEWATIENLKPGDQATLTFDVGIRMLGKSKKATLAWGPVLLAIDELYNATGPTDTEKPWSGPDEISVPPSLALLGATGLAVPPQWPELCFRAGAAVLSPLARSLPNNPVCAPSTRLRYKLDIFE